MIRRIVHLLCAGIATISWAFSVAGMQLETVNVTRTDQSVSYRMITVEDFDGSVQPETTTPYQTGKAISGWFTAENAPLLPTSTRYIEVAPGTNPRIEVNIVSSNRSNAPGSLQMFDRTDNSVKPFTSTMVTGLQPPTCYSVGKRVSFRGREMIPITLYPVQYDDENNQLIENREIEVTITGALTTPNPSTSRTRSDQIIASLQDGALGRDDFNTSTPNGGYLVVVREECLPFAIPLLEWKRQAGHAVKILSYAGGISAAAIKADIQEYYDELVDNGEEPFEYLFLIGDRERNQGEAPWTLPSFIGEPSMPGIAPHADFIYGLLDNPDDPVMDVAVGRMTSGNQNRMELAVNRQLLYEKTPNMADPSWFTRGGVACQSWDDQLNFETFYNVRWCYSALANIGFDDILYYENQVPDLSGGSIAPVMAEWLHTGFNIWIARAQIRAWDNNLAGVNPVEHGMFPYGINMTAHGEFPGEWIYGEGDGENLKGAVLWTTGWGQPATLFNNGILQTMVNGVLNGGLPAGWARTLIGLEWEGRYPNDTLWRGTYQTDFDLYGDPGLLPWTSVPKRVELNYESAPIEGSNYFTVNATLPGRDEPVADVTVTLYAPGELPEPEQYAAHTPALQMTGVTDANGVVSFEIDGGFPAGTLFLTASGRNICPEWEVIDLEANNEPNLVVENVRITNGNPVADSSFSITFSVANVGNAVAQDVRGNASSFSTFATIANDAFNLGNIAAGATVALNRELQIDLSSFASDGAIPELVMNLRSGDVSWQSQIHTEVSAEKLAITGIPASLELGAQASLLPRLTNSGHAMYDGGTVRLISKDWRITVIDENVTYPAIAIGQSATPEHDDDFLIRTTLGAMAGGSAELLFVISSSGRVVDTLNVELALIDAVAGRGPEPADDYGYTCLDESDTLWFRFPFPNWLEISRDEEGEGDLVQLHERLDTAQTVPLPFPLKFYGIEYDSITICDNGFVSVGTQFGNVNFENYRMEFATGGAVGMIAPFWESLTLQPFQGRPNDVYTFYDETNHRYIVEWYDVHPKETLNVSFNFQLQILDSEYYTTVTGDNPLLFHYNSISHQRIDEDAVPFASVGISSPRGDTGLGVNFDSTGTAHTPLVRSRSRLLFITTPKITEGESGAIHGRLSRRADNEPILNEPVVITGFGLGKIWQSETDDDGRYTISGIVPGDYYLEIHRAGYNPIRRRLTINAGDDQQIDLSMTSPTIFFSQPYSDRQVFEHRDSLRPPPPIMNFRRGIYIRNNGDGVLNYHTSTVNDAGVGVNWFRIDNGISGSIEPGAIMPLVMTISNYGFSADADTTLNGFLVVNDTISGLTSRLPIIVNFNQNNDVRDDEFGAPLQWSLGDCYPNPFNATTRIDFSVAASEPMSLNLYDLQGRLVKLIAQGPYQPGEYSLAFTADELPPGLYLLRLEAGAFLETRKLVLVK